MSAAGEHGMDIWLDECLYVKNGSLGNLAESQERMLVVVEKGKEQQVLDVFDNGI